MTTMCWMRSSPDELGCVVVQPVRPAAIPAAIAMLRRRLRAIVPPHTSAQCGSRQLDFGAHGAGAIVPCGQIDRVTRLRADDPLDLHPIVGHMIVRPKRDAGVLVRLPFELAH